jgi:FkbM family methyltransferase
VSELSKYWKVSPTGVLHVGAHFAEEALDYEKFGWTPVIWVEAQPSLIQALKSKLDPSKHKVIEAAIWVENGVDLKLHIASNSQSTSLLEFGSHSDSYPDITFVSEIDVTTKRLDSIIRADEMPNFINLDVQGVELPAIKSLGNLLLSVDYIYSEVNKSEVYQSCTLISELDDYLSLNGFKRVTSRWYIQEGWGDAFYVRDTKIVSQSLFRKIIILFINEKFYLRQFASLCKKYLSQKLEIFININKI